MTISQPKTMDCLTAAGLQDRVLLPTTEGYGARIDSYFNNSAKLAPMCILMPQTTAEVASAVEPVPSHLGAASVRHQRSMVVVSQVHSKTVGADRPVPTSHHQLELGSCTKRRVRRHQFRLSSPPLAMTGHPSMDPAIVTRYREYLYPRIDSMNVETM